MSSHRRIPRSARTVVVAGALLLALGSGPLTMTTATAAPVTAVNGPSFPDPGAPGEKPKKDEHLDKADKLGGGVTSKIIDFMADTLKCTLNIALPSVKCG